MAAPAPISFGTLKAVARSKGYRLGIGETPGALVVLEKRARDRHPMRFADRDAALGWLRSQPDVKATRY